MLKSWTRLQFPYLATNVVIRDTLEWVAAGRMEIEEIKLHATDAGRKAISPETATR